MIGWRDKKTIDKIGQAMDVYSSEFVVSCEKTIYKANDFLKQSICISFVSTGIVSLLCILALYIRFRIFGG